MPRHQTKEAGHFGELCRLSICHSRTKESGRMEYRDLQSRTYGTPRVAVHINQPLKWQATFVLPLWGLGGEFAQNGQRTYKRRTQFLICSLRF